MTCPGCGREAENGVPTHYIGCGRTRKPLVEQTETVIEPLPGADRCAKDGCTNLRAASRGPRPTKYCDEHKTGSKK